MVEGSIQSQGRAPIRCRDAKRKHNTDICQEKNKGACILFNLKKGLPLGGITRSIWKSLVHYYTIIYSTQEYTIQVFKYSISRKSSH